MAWKNASYVLSSPLSKKILEALQRKSPLAPLQIAKETDIARSNVSTKLIGLRKLRLVECINPEAKKWRLYRITAEGKKALKEAASIQD